MLKNRSIQVRMVNDNKDGVVTTSAPLDVEQINRIMKEQVQNAAIAFGSVMIARRLADTLGIIAVNVVNSKLYR